MDLYADYHPKTSKKGLGFKDKAKALHTLDAIQKQPLTYQKQVVITMYNRAKFYPNQTSNMRDAMQVFRTWLRKYNIKT